MRGLIAALAGLLASGAAASSAGTNPLTYKVLRANATATLSFRQTDLAGTSTDTGRVTLSAKKSAIGKAILSSRGGSLSVPIRWTVSERVRLKRPTGAVDEYQVTTCKQPTVHKGRGKLKLRRSGKKVIVRWGFPQAQPSFCPGPKVGKSLTSRQTARYPASRFGTRDVVLVIAGSQAVDRPTLQASYRWRLTVLLERVD